ncbi:CBS domain-containing protein [Nanohaloarchaea archaeon H01]|nr:CBS domain-containing protein [Nanohaloarchaea archaeon H01]
MKEEVQVKEVMTDGVIAIEKDKTVVEAAKLLEEEEIRGLVVVEDGEAVGVIVCRDIAYQVVADGLEPSDTKVKDVMSTDLIVAEETELLDDVAMAMVRNNISRVPVVRDDMLVGILTQSDILRAWPGFAEIIGERQEMEAPATPREKSQEGVCEECGNYSEDLREFSGELLCPECRRSADLS